MEVIFIFKKVDFNVEFEIFWLKHFRQCSICDNTKIFFTSKFNYVLFCNPTNKTKIGTTNRWGTTNSKSPRPIFMLGQFFRNTNQHLYHIYYILFCRCTMLLHLLPNMRTYAIMLSQKHFFELNWHMWDFVHSILLCRIAYWALLEMLF
jgi:hypothetical protein